MKETLSERMLAESPVGTLSVFSRNQPSYGTVPKLSLGPDDQISSLP
jgi:hypothetical protein